MAPRSRLFSGVPAALATIGLCACAGESTPEPRRERVQGEIGRPTNSLYADFAESRISGGPDGYAALDALPAAPGDGLRFDELSSYLGLYDVVPGWGLSWTDFDLDGDPDLFVADHMHYPSALYVNEGGLRFRKLEGSLGHDIYLDDHMGVWADFDGDALPDLYTANGFYRPDHLMRNAGDGRFQDVAAETGLSVDESGRGRSALWADFDGDGWNDLLVLNLRTPDYYYRNAAGRFEDATERSGMSNAFSKEGAVSGDLDGDLDLDVFLPVLRRGVPNVVWLNRGDGSFRAVDGGRASQEGGSHAAAMGDYDNDGDLDLYLAAHQDSPGALLRNRGDGSFEDVTAEAGITLESSGGRSAAFVDLDNDGWLDLFVACGGGLDGPSRANALYRNRGNGRFENVAGEAGLRGLSNGRTASAAFADYNLDGYLDIAVTNGGDALAISGQHLLYRNAGGTSRWLWVHAPAAPGNLDGIGAEVRLTLADGRVRVRRAGLVQTMGQNEPGAHFGLGEATGAAEVAVRWPSGREARVQGVPAGQRIVVRRPSESSYLRAHPAALVGDTDRGALEALLAHLGGALEPAPPTDPEVQSRLDELLAWKTATDAAAQLEVPSAALDAAWSEEEQRFQLPRRMWLEQVAIGPFTMRDKPPKLHWDLAESVYEELVAGGDVLEVAERHGVRAWARVYKKGGSYAPNLGAEDESVRGYVEAGWLTPEMVSERYGDAAEALLGLEPGEVYGPLPLREGRDVQDPEKVWPVLRVFRVVAVEAEGSVPRSVVEEDLRREVRRRGLRRVLGERKAALPASATASVAELWIEGVACRVGPLAAAARERGLLDDPTIRQAWGRITLEVAADRALRARIAAEIPTEQEVEAYADARRDRWMQPRRVRGSFLFFVDAAQAEQARALLLSGRALAEVREELEIPSLRTRSARTNALYSVDLLLSEAIVQRMLGAEAVEPLFATPAGQPSPLFPFRDGAFLVVPEELLPAEPAASAWARSRARSELERERARAVADRLLRN